MSDNPLEDNPDREQRIRERAYYLWEADGCPAGNDLEYWERARELVGMSDSAGTAQVQVPAPDDPAVMAGQAIEEASIQQNLGEFPDRVADQGEHPQVPDPRNRAA